MNKHMPPPMKMKVEPGRLVPVGAFDAERLNSYRVGSTVNVRFTADRMRPLERKYRAILGKVVKECDTPWTNTETAHQALKLACGYVNVGRAMNGEFMQWPRSLVDFNDKEMEDYFEEFLKAVYRLTGVDAETLRRETADVDQDDDVPVDPETGELSPDNSSSEALPQDASDESEAPSAASHDGAPSDEVTPVAEPDGAPVNSEPSLFAKWNYAAGELQHLRDFAAKALKDARSDKDELTKRHFLDSMTLNYRDELQSADARKALDGMERAINAVIDGRRTAVKAEAWIQTEFLGGGE